MLGNYSRAVLEKAKKLKEDCLTPHPTSADTWQVTSSRTGKVHNVQVYENFIVCTCTHGKHSGGFARCYHAAAVELRLEEKPDPQPLPSSFPFIGITQ